MSVPKSAAPTITQYRHRDATPRRHGAPEWADPRQKPLFYTILTLAVLVFVLDLGIFGALLFPQVLKKNNTHNEHVPFGYFLAVAAADTAFQPVSGGIFFTVDFEFPILDGDGVSGGCGDSLDEGWFGAPLRHPGLGCFADDDVFLLGRISIGNTDLSIRPLKDI